MGSEQDMYDRLIVAVMNKFNCFKPEYLLLFGKTEVAGGTRCPRRSPSLSWIVINSPLKPQLVFSL